MVDENISGLDAEASYLLLGQVHLFSWSASTAVKTNGLPSHFQELVNNVVNINVLAFHYSSSYELTNLNYNYALLPLFSYLYLGVLGFWGLSLVCR